MCLWEATPEEVTGTWSWSLLVISICSAVQQKLHRVGIPLASRQGQRRVALLVNAIQEEIDFRTGSYVFFHVFVITTTSASSNSSVSYIAYSTLPCPHAFFPRPLLTRLGFAYPQLQARQVDTESLLLFDRSSCTIALCTSFSRVSSLPLCRLPSK